MASILRSCKFIRFFAGFARNIAFGTGRQDAFEAPAITSNQNLYSGLAIRALATQTARHDTSLEKSLRRLDQDARRAGRISRRELDEVLEEIKQTRSATSSQSLMVIRCCGSLVPEEHPEVRTKLVQEIWNTLEALGVPMDISHYNALLRVYLENEHQFSPSEFLEELERKGVEPNRVTYQRLVARHCQQGDMEGAAKILQIMRDQQLPVNESVFNALVTGHAQAGDMESARGILGVMNQAGLEPGAETYTALLSGHAKRGDMEAVRAVLAECETQKVELLDRDFLSIIYSLATSGHEKHIDEILGHLKKQVGYNQDCINLILRLVNAGLEDVGLKLVTTLVPARREDSSEQQPSGFFFIKQLVKADRPIEKVVGICEDLQKNDVHPRALLVAMETALTLGRHEACLALATAIKNQGQPLRQHYFWPLLAHHSKNKNPQGIYDVLRHMQSVGVTPLIETLKDYALPGLTGSPDQKVSQLRSAGVSVGAASCSMALNLLANNNLKAAAELVTQYRAVYTIGTFRRPIAQAFAATKDVPSLLKILQVVVNSKAPEAPAAEGEGEKVETETPGSDAGELAGQIVLDCFKALRTDAVPIVQAILEGLVECGQSLSANTAEQLQERFGADLTPELSTLLTKLTSGSLVPTHVTPEQSQVPAMDGKDLENLLKTTEAKGLPTRNVRRQLLHYYCRTKDLEKAEEIKKGLEAEDFVFQAGSLALILELYCHYDKLEEALAVKSKLVERDPEFQLDSIKTLKLAALLIKNDRLEEAVDMLKSQTAREVKEERILFAVRAQSWRILNSLAEQGRVDDLQKVFEAIVGGGMVPINNVILGPLIKVHLTKDDVKAALDRFEWCCQQHHATPWKSELACRLIHAEDAASLQRLTDLSTQVHGEVNSLYDLVLAFVECGRVRQARRILETPGLRSRPYRLTAACQRYSDEGQIASLEGLVEATKDLSHIDRENIYLHLLNTYCKAEETDKALGLWTQAQEEDVQPSDEFLHTLGNFLKKQGRDVPFSIPEASKVEPKVESKSQSESQKLKPRQTKTSSPPKPLTEAVSADLQLFRQALRRQDVDQAMELKNVLESKKKTLSVRDSSLLIENLVNSERISLAAKVMMDMLESGLHPLPRVFRYLLNKLALAGDVDALTTIGNYLDDEKKKMVSFDNRLCNAHIVAGRAHIYLDNLEKSLTAADTDEALTALAASFPRGGALGILEKHPELEPKFATIAAKFAERGETAPTNVLWMQYFVRGQREDAQKLWEQHLLQQPRLMFQWVCQVARRNTNSQLAADLFSLLVSTPSTSPGARGNVLSCLLDVLTTEKKYDDALHALSAAQKDVGLDYVNRTALIRLKSGLEEQGKTFPFTIPSKSASKASSSSSSSDDDIDEKKQ